MTKIPESVLHDMSPADATFAIAWKLNDSVAQNKKLSEHEELIVILPFGAELMSLTGGRPLKIVLENRSIDMILRERDATAFGMYKSEKDV